MQTQHQKERAKMLLIVVTFIAGSAWGPLVSIQTLPTPEACTSTMKTVAETILGAAKSNVTSELIIESDNSSGLKIIFGINRRVMAAITCKAV